MEFRLGKDKGKAVFAIFFFGVACFLQLSFLVACIDYVKVEDDSVNNKSYSYPPVIDHKHLYPPPASLLAPISVGNNCKGQVFKVPPIEDQNKNQKLYYLWFLDNRLMMQQSIIEPEFRDSAIITVNIDKHFLLSHYEATKIPKDFYNRPHVIEFYVSDVEFSIPESRYIDDNKKNEKTYSDYAYWIASFNDDSCR